VSIIYYSLFVLWCNIPCKLSSYRSRNMGITGTGWLASSCKYWFVLLFKYF